MKATDLMVGDFVNVNDLPLRVGAIRQDELGFFDNDYKIYWCSDDEFDRIDPIPLTEDILVKNGFVGERRSKYFHLYTLEFDTWDFEIYWGSVNGFSYENIKLSYVHELQHLLRLVGIQKEIEL